jgi:DNA modification methylase
MKTRHQIHFSDSREMSSVSDKSVHLVVTSPPYPMIAMWDRSFSDRDADIGKQISAQNGAGAFELMHRCLDPVWEELWRVLVNGGIACINVGDATRKIGSDFSLYPNHARILSRLVKIGFTPLPPILWRKPTNAPTKFMGSGMLPAGAYVTLEHEYILIVRKGPRREFKNPSDKQVRRESAIFWEERNDWYSDIWFKVIGTGQRFNSKTTRQRSAAFPFEIPYRLINMYSVKGDTVLDPFVGTGTTLKASAVAARNSLGIDIDCGLKDSIFDKIDTLPDFAGTVVSQRLAGHRQFVAQRTSTRRPLKYINKPYRFPVVTSQETDLFLDPMLSAEMVDSHCFKAIYHRGETEP